MYEKESETRTDRQINDRLAFNRVVAREMLLVDWEKLCDP